ncbi:MAG: hypothetical protein HOB33_13220 [Bacteroidetes Order II. Incertae sedis bacterium]|nr:hypothetical protein [Bacteroidetes Order II. bacterium]
MPVDIPAPYIPPDDWAYSDVDLGNESRLKVLFVGNFRGTLAPIEVPLSAQHSGELLGFWSPSMDLELHLDFLGSKERVFVRYQPSDIVSFLSPLPACRLVSGPLDVPHLNTGILKILGGLLSDWESLQREIRAGIERGGADIEGVGTQLPSVALQSVIEGLQLLKGRSASDSQLFELDQVYLDLSELYEQVQDAIRQDAVFKELKESWLGLDRILKAGMSHHFLEIWALNASPRALLNDCDLDVANTDLYSAIYQSEIGQYGGDPFSAVVLGFPFGFSSETSAVYKYLATIGELASTPMLLDPGLSLLKANDHSILDGLENIRIELDSSLRNISAETCGSFLFLTPQSSVIAVRQTTGLGDGGVSRELGIFDCAGSVDLVIDLIQTLIDLRGTVPDLQQDALDYEVRPVYWFGPSTVETLQSNGMILPVCVHPQRPLKFDGARPIGGIHGDTHSSQRVDGIRPPELVGLVQILRILHKLKGWARDNIGSSMSVNERVAAINDQIGTFVLDTPKPRAELLRTRPLSTGFCEIFDDPDITRDSYRLTFRLHEHRNYPVGELITHIGLG